MAWVPIALYKIYMHSVMGSRNDWKKNNKRLTENAEMTERKITKDWRKTCFRFISKKRGSHYIVSNKVVHEAHARFCNNCIKSSYTCGNPGARCSQFVANEVPAGRTKNSAKNIFSVECTREEAVNRWMSFAFSFFLPCKWEGKMGWCYHMERIGSDWLIRVIYFVIIYCNIL